MQKNVSYDSCTQQSSKVVSQGAQRKGHVMIPEVHSLPFGSPTNTQNITASKINRIV